MICQLEVLFSSHLSFLCYSSSSLSIYPLLSLSHLSPSLLSPCCVYTDQCFYHYHINHTHTHPPHPAPSTPSATQGVRGSDSWDNRPPHTPGTSSSPSPLTPSPPTHTAQRPKPHPHPNLPNPPVPPTNPPSPGRFCLSRQPPFNTHPDPRSSHNTRVTVLLFKLRPQVSPPLTLSSLYAFLHSSDACESVFRYGTLSQTH